MATKAKSAVPEGFRTVTPHMIFEDTSKAIDWYKKALGAQELARALGPDGRVMHAVIRIGDSVIMANDEMGERKSPAKLGGSPVSIWLYVEDCDALHQRATAAGAIVHPGPMGRVSDQFWGDRAGTFTDPFGYLWTVATRKEDVPEDEMKRRMDEFMSRFAGSQP